MNILRLSLTAIISILLSFSCMAQNDLNKTDQKGLKQGKWVKKYPNQVVMYEGFFKDDHPVGEFKRYYEDNTLRSLLIYSNDGIEAEATIYHPNGYISSKGKYINQMKEGKWQFFSPENNGYLICEEYYSGNVRNGLSLKYYQDSTIAEKVNYVRGVKNGEWVQYFENGRMWIRSSYLNGKLDGKFEVWFENGTKSFSGQYKNDSRDGTWIIYNRDGSIKYKIEYRNGYTDDKRVDIDESNYLDSLERNKGKIPDPEITGNMW
jgi:antitoxin component YwqK of YwqJK toxin-antitoxin module